MIIRIEIKSFVRLCLIGFFLANLTIADAQNLSEIESLKSKLTQTKKEIDKINLLNQISAIYYASDSANTFLFADQAISKAKTINFKRGVAEALENKASYFIARSKPLPAQPFVKEAATIWQSLKDELGIATNLHKQGQICLLLSEYDNAISLLKKAEVLFLKYNNTHGEQVVYHTSGLVYDLKGEKQTAAEYFIKSLNLQEKNHDDKEIYSTQNNLGKMLFDLKNYDESKKYYNQSLEISLSKNDLRNAGITQLNLANIYITQTDYPKAIQLLEKALQNFEKINFKRGIQSCYNNLGALNIRIVQYDTAISYLKKALTVAKENQTQIGVALVEQNIGYTYALQKNYTESLVWFKNAEKTANIYNTDTYTFGEIFNHRSFLDSSMGNYESALNYRTKYWVLNEKTLNEKTIKQTAELQTKYETDRKDLKISLFNKSDSIKSLEIVNQQLALNISNVQIEKQNLALSNAQLELSSKNEIILQNQLDSVKNGEKISNLNKEAIIQKLELSNQTLAANRKNTFLLVAGVAAALLSLLGFSFYRRTQLQKQANLQKEIFDQREQATKNILNKQEMRRQIAFDLHDEIGSSLSSISLLNERIKSVVNTNPTEAQSLLERVSTNVRSSIENTQTIIWAIDSRYDKLNDLINQMKEFAGSLGDIQKFDWKMPNEKTLKSIELSPDLKKNLYLIFKEGINNGVKYAKSDTISIQLEIENKDLILRIYDFGKGFERNLLSKTLGLSSIENRAKILGGEAQIKSVLNKGTSIQVKVPISH